MNARYLLDTNICIHFLRGDFNLNGKLAEVGFDQCAISEITLIELIYGAENSRNSESNLKVVRAFQESLAVLSISVCIHRFGKEKVRLRKAGRPISDFDLLIGCTASEHGLVLITENGKDFRNIENLRMENWVVR